MTVVYLRRDLGPGRLTFPPREGTVGQGPGLSPIINYLYTYLFVGKSSFKQKHFILFLDTI